MRLKVARASFAKREDRYIARARSTGFEPLEYRPNTPGRLMDSECFIRRGKVCARLGPEARVGERLQ